MAEVNLPAIPETITVHLGPPGSNAENVTIPFIDYIKNVVSSEIFPTWPENAIRANIYAIISFALNRLYTEYYRARGYDFDITNTTQYDQAFNPNGQIFDNISQLVDELFNDYVVREGSVSPLFAQFCNGTTSVCEGLSQWGTVDLANQGLTPFEILQRFYGNDINIISNAPVNVAEESYPGAPIKIGDAGNAVKIIQTQLNRIGQNYPAIPKIDPVDGIFGVTTEDAVKKFQEIFDLPQTGIVNEATWYKIKQYYNGVKRLSELVSEGITLEEASLPFTRVLSVGMQGEPVRILQYYLSVLSYFNPSLKEVPINGVFGEETRLAVSEFQLFYGLPVTGVVNAETWNTLSRIYIETIASLPPGYQGERAKFYPGFFLSEGMENESVRDFQTYLSVIAQNYPEIPEVPVTGVFGTETRDAVYTFQRLFGLPQNGAVGPITWYTVANEYNRLVGAPE